MNLAPSNGECFDCTFECILQHHIYCIIWHTLPRQLHRDKPKIRDGFCLMDRWDWRFVIKQRLFQSQKQKHGPYTEVSHRYTVCVHAVCTVSCIRVSLCHNRQPVAYWFSCLTWNRRVGGSIPGVVTIRSAQLLGPWARPLTPHRSRGYVSSNPL